MASHETLTSNELQTRAGLHAQGPIFNESSDDKKMSRMLWRINRLESRQPGKTSGRHMFLRDLVWGVRNVWEGSRAAVSYIGAQQIMEGHGELFETLSAHDQKAYESKAQVHIQDQRAEVQQKVGELKQAVRLMKQRLAQADAHGPPMNVRCFRLKDRELVRLCEMLNSKEFDRRGVQAILDNRLGSPAALAEEDQRDINFVVKQLYLPPRTPFFWWTSILCLHRDAWQSCAFKHTAQPGVVHLFLYALQKPYEIGFLSMKRHARNAPGEETTPEGNEGIAMTWRRHSFVYMPFRLTSWEQLPWPHDDEVFVLQGLAVVNNCLKTDLEWEPLARVARRQIV